MSPSALLSFSVVTLLIRDPTMKDVTVGVNFYTIRERGRQHGPFGILHPLRNVTGVSHEDIDSVHHMDKARHYSLTHLLSLLFRKVITGAKDMTTIKKFVHSAQMILWTRT